MNREIKFRAWDIKRKKMWSPEEMGEDQLTLMPDGRGFINVSGTLTKLSQFCSNLIPQQFTGFKDKNGKEIYEGDICQAGTYAEGAAKWDKVYEVQFDQYEWMFCPGKTSDIIPFRETTSMFVEILGNIHNNPSLLEDGK